MIEDSEESRRAAAELQAALPAKGELRNYYFTFGGDRLQKYVHIVAVDRDAARECMFQHYGIKWAFCYDDEQFTGQVEKYGLKMLESLTA